MIWLRATILEAVKTSSERIGRWDARDVEIVADWLEAGLGRGR
jgi:hypothetical protein